MPLEKISVETRKRDEFIDITHHVSRITNGIEDSVVTVFCPHTTAGITINENADPDVVSDILRKLGELIPKNDRFIYLMLYQ